MYQFTDIIETGVFSKGSIHTIINGVDLDETIPEFQTLNVTGRRQVAQEVKTTDRVGGDGAWVDSLKLKPRTLSIETRIQSANILETFSAVNAHLYRGKLEITFSDEAGAFYFAYFQGMSSRKDDSNTQILTMTFLCPDPWIYGAESTTTAAVASAWDYPVSIEYIKVTPAAAGGSLVVTNAGNGQTLILEGAVNAGAVYAFYFGREPIVTMNGEPIADRLRLWCDYDTFSMSAGDAVSAVPSSAIEVKYRERWL